MKSHVHVRHCTCLILLFSLISSTAEGNNQSPYEVKKIKLGVEVYGFNVSEFIPEETLAQIKRDITKYKILIFKNQGVVDAAKQVEISSYFGEVELKGFYNLHNMPHPLVLRLSNDEDVGVRFAGTDGFHVDGSYLKHPQIHAIYHMINASTGGKTAFIDSNKAVQSLSDEKFARWDRLWIVRYSEYDGEVTHPLIYAHPDTGQYTFCLHLGRTVAFVWDYGSPEERRTDQQETKELVREIDAEFRKNNEELIYFHHWEAGEFIIIDNLALAHYACPETQLPPEQVGVRVMHRTTIKGTNVPTKHKKGKRASDKDGCDTNDESCPKRDEL